MGEMAEPLPQEAIDAARLRLKRKIASVIMYAMAESGLSVEQLEHRIRRPQGFTWRFLRGLMKGTNSALNDISDLLLAMDCELEMNLRTLELPEPSESEPCK